MIVPSALCDRGFGLENRITMLLFTVLHEAAHVVLRHVTEAPSLDEGVGPAGGEIDAAADEMASEGALPKWGPVT